MHFAKYWAKAGFDGATAWGWSDTSETEAKVLAEARVREALKIGAERARERAAGKFPPRGGKYWYDRGPVREQVLERIAGERDRMEVAIISKNVYGCEVLNTERIMFVDIDQSGEAGRGPGIMQRILGLLGKGKAPAQPVAEDAELAVVDQWVKQNSQWSFRAYRTAGGYRLLAIHDEVPVDSPDADRALESLGADPNYRTLCKHQHSYRARLTPKPWRCGHAALSVRWPFEDKSKERTFEHWEQEYQIASSGFATCRFLRVIGSPMAHRSVRDILTLHDERTKALSSLPLA